jgi:2,3-bisphosphoglycerate-dependent phosphoglycerate mutase
VVPEIEAGRNVMIAAHGNSLRSIIMYLDKLTSQEVASISSSCTLCKVFLVLCCYGSC